MLRRFALVRALVLATAVGGTACIPYHRTERVSPPLVGSIRNSDNSPASGVLVALVASDRPKRCRDASRWVTTDQTGRFEMPASYVQEDWLLVLPPMEGFFTVFELCVGRDSTALTSAYIGMSPLKGEVRADTVQCILWSARGVPQQSCAGRTRHPFRNVQSSGSWTNANASGSYRLLVPPEASRAEVALLQWVQRLDGGGERVVDSLPLPMAPEPYEIAQALLHTSAASTCVVVRSFGGKAHWYSNAKVVATILELGPPGKTTPRAACGRA
jgi:hypothetical protein